MGLFPFKNIPILPKIACFRLKSIKTLNFKSLINSNSFWGRHPSVDPHSKKNGFSCVLCPPTQGKYTNFHCTFDLGDTNKCYPVSAL